MKRNARGRSRTPKEATRRDSSSELLVRQIVHLLMTIQQSVCEIQKLLSWMLPIW